MHFGFVFSIRRPRVGPIVTALSVSLYLSVGIHAGSFLLFHFVSRLFSSLLTLLQMSEKGKMVEIV